MSPSISTCPKPAHFPSSFAGSPVSWSCSSSPSDEIHCVYGTLLSLLRAAIYGVAQSRTWLKWLSSSRIINLIDVLIVVFWSFPPIQCKLFKARLTQGSTGHSIPFLISKKKKKKKYSFIWMKENQCQKPWLEKCSPGWISGHIHSLDQAG